MYEKLGASLSKLHDTNIHICGYEAPVPLKAPANVFFHSLFNFKRLSPGRATAQVKYYKLLKKLSPTLIIVCTHELLFISYLYCSKYKCKLVYDVQENYKLNLLKQHNYNSLTKRLLAFGVEKIEKLTSAKVSHFLLAEKSYATELSFIDDRFTLIQNKYKKPHDFYEKPTPVFLKDKALKFIFSGTIAEEYGIYEAITLAEEFHKLDSRTSLTIIGYCAKNETWQRVQNLTKGKRFIKVIGGDKLLPHTDIIHEIRSSNVGLLPYQPNESTFSCIPTKLYEYMAYGLPILITENPIWHTLVKHNDAGVSIDFRNTNVPRLEQLLQGNEFYSLGIPKDIFWDDEEKKLLGLIRTL